MNKIVYVGMDVHKEKTSLVCFEPSFDGSSEKGKFYGSTEVATDAVKIQNYIETMKKHSEPNTEYRCGYEAGCLGFSLYKNLSANNVDCTILAPSTMLTQMGKRIKTDSRDAQLIAQSLAYGTYSAVHIPSEEDEANRDFIRMRDDHVLQLKVTKQRINSFCLRKGYTYTGTKWSKPHISWLKEIKLNPLDRETLNQYLATYVTQESTIATLDNRILELAQNEAYKDKVNQLICILGITVMTALSFVVEVGDFNRFAKAENFASYLGLTPGEHSSGGTVHREGITKSGNTHLRRLAIEASQGICRGAVGYKSKNLLARQKGNTPEVIAYADKASLRLRKRYYALTKHSVKRNVAVTAVARELSCFIWGMMTDHRDVI